MTALLRSWALALGGDVSGGRVLCPGPGHSALDRSLSVSLSARSPDDFVVHSFSGDDPIACKDYVRAKLGMPAFAPARPAGHQVSPGYRDIAAPAKPPSEPPPDHRAPALRIWQQAADPRGTLVERYLGSRALGMPDEAANEAIRFHPVCPMADERHPAMICLVRNIETNEPQAFTAPPLCRTARPSSATAKPSACLSAQRQAALSRSIPARM